MNRIDIKNLTKRYGRVQALNDVSFQLESGKIYGLLGRNGAGKTTLLNIIANRLFADSGEVTVDGLPAKENDAAQGLIYFMGEKNYYPHNLRVSEAFKWTKAFYPDFDVALAQNLCEQFKLNPGKRIRELSTGYSSIHKIITALCVNAPIPCWMNRCWGWMPTTGSCFIKRCSTATATTPAPSLSPPI